MTPTTRPAALAAEQAWRAGAAVRPVFTPAAPERRLSLVREQLEWLNVAVLQLEALRVDIISAATARHGVPQIEVAAADGERAFGPQAATCASGNGRTVLHHLMLAQCLVYWHQPAGAT